MTHQNFNRALELTKKINQWEYTLEQLNRKFKIKSVIITDWDGGTVYRDNNTDDQSAPIPGISPAGLQYIEERKKELQSLIDEAKKEFETL